MKRTVKIVVLGGILLALGATASAGENLCSNPLYKGLPACQGGK